MGLASWIIFDGDGVKAFCSDFIKNSFEAFCSGSILVSVVSKVCSNFFGVFFVISLFSVLTGI